MKNIAIFVLVLFVVWRILTSVGKRMVRESAGAEDFSRFSARRRDRRSRFRKHEGVANEDLVECAGCTTWLPSSRAIRDDDGRVFCSESCRDVARVTGTA